MRNFFIMLFLIFIITINASEVRGNKVVLASFKTLDEAQKHLEEFGSQLTPEEIDLQQQYHFEIIARRSGDVFIVAMEPFEDEKSAKTIANHFNKIYPDALVNNYYGPTEGAIVWHKKEELPKVPEKVELPKNVDLTPIKQESDGYMWIIISGLSSVFIAVFFWSIREKKRNKNSPPINQYEKIKTQFFSTNGWKYDEALHRAGGNKEYLKLTIETFLIDAPRLLNDLKEAFKRDQFSEMQLRSHALKSLAASIASSSLRVSAQRLEYSSKEKNRELIETNLHECEAVIENIITLLQDSPIHEEEDVKSIHNDPLILTSLLESLRENLRKCIFLDVTRLKVFDIAVDAKREPLMVELKMYVEKLEYIKALELIEQLQKMDK